MNHKHGIISCSLLLLIGPFLTACGEDQNGATNPTSSIDNEGFRSGLLWTNAITAQTMQALPHALVEDASLLEIVSSRHVARADGLLCSSCHYATSAVTYRPNIVQDGGALIGPFDVVDGRTWAGEEGWARRFLALHEDTSYTKPLYLRNTFARWITDGQRYKLPLLWQAPITEATLGETPEEFVDGATLLDVINDRVSARPDALMCGECHYPGSVARYRPTLAPNRHKDILPMTIVDGRPWAGSDGWAERFIAHGPTAETEKPAYLRNLFALWLVDGEK